jgi:hypothetical protein
MCIRPLSRRAVALSLAAVLAIVLLPLEVAPAEAARFTLRYRSVGTPRYVNPADEGRQTRAPFRFYVRRGSGSSSDDARDENGRPRPLGAAAAAAARAQAALAAEKAAAGRTGAAVLHDPIPVGDTTNYANGVTCVAGC